MPSILPRRKGPQAGPRTIRSVSSSGRAIVASAMSVNIGDRSEVKRLTKTRQSWQGEAWAYRRNVGELRYADAYLSNACMRLRIHPAVYTPGEVAPVEVTPETAQSQGIPPTLAQAALDVMDRLATGGPTAMAQIIKKLTSNFEIAGECYLVGQTDPVTRLETWGIKSVNELRPQQSGEVYLSESPLLTNISDMTLLPPDLSVVERLWWPDPEWSMMADSPVRAELDTLEELLLLSRDVRATARSRIANNGLLFIPDEMTIIGPEPETDDDEADPFTASLMRSMETAMTNEGSAAAVVPVVVRGPGASGALIKHITFERQQNKFNINQRSELIGRLATGLDLPAEVLTGKADLNHWSSWQVDDDTFRHHIEPIAIVEVDALTAGYLWPQLDAMNAWAPEIVRRIVLWYDPTELVTHPDKALDAKDAYDRGAIGRDALRKYLGMTDEDAPDELDAMLYILEHARGVDPSLLTALLKTVAKNIVIPDLQPKTDVEVDPATGEPIPSTDAPVSAAPAAPAAPENNSPNTNPGPPTPSAAGDTAGASVTDAEIWAEIDALETANNITDIVVHMDVLDNWLGIYQGIITFNRNPLRLRMMKARYTVAKKMALLNVVAAATPEPESKSGTASDSRKLLDIDRDLRVKLQTAANAAVKGVLEKAGAKIVSKSRTAAASSVREAIKDVPKALIAASLGRAVVASLGLTEKDLMDSAFADLQKQWTSWVDDANEQALRAAARIAGVDVNAAYAQLAGTFADDADEGWEWLTKQLSASVQKWLTTAPTEDIEVETTDFVSTGSVRAAISLAGGFGNGDTSKGLSANGRPVDKTEPMGGIGTGANITGFMNSNGVETSSYQWVHGGTDRPFPPHEELDGVEFANFDDPVLLNDTGFPDGDYYTPGDHDGCTCDFFQLWSTSDDGSSSTSSDDTSADDTSADDSADDGASEDADAA